MHCSVKTRSKGALLCLVAAFMAACASSPERAATTDRPQLVLAQQPATTSREGHRGTLALTVARELVGTPYRYGGTDPSGFDCSGLVHYSYAQAGISVPRTSQDLFSNSKRINLTDLHPGDLIFFHISQQKISHVGTYDSHNRFIHAPSPGKGVSYASLENPYWRERVVGVGRF